MKRHNGLIKLVGVGIGALKLVKHWTMLLKKSFVQGSSVD